MACSALKHSYRQLLSPQQPDPRVAFVSSIPQSEIMTAAAWSCISPRSTAGTDARWLSVTVTGCMALAEPLHCMLSSSSLLP